MRPNRLFVPLAPLALFVGAASCGTTTVPDDPGARIFPAAGVIEGSVVYQGPHPCSSNGHIVGNAILLVFDQNNPPPPNGLAVTAVNFADVTGDTLFANEPRYTGSDVYCPADHGFTDTITASQPFAISPMAGGSYLIEAFFDYTGNFLPTFKIRNLPEMGDVGGGDIDTANALESINAGNPNYQPHFLPVNVGVPELSDAGGEGGATSLTYAIPSNGYVTNNVVVTMGEQLPTTRPYFYPQGLSTTLSSDQSSITYSVTQSSDVPAPGLTGIQNTVEDDADYAPILTIPQDILSLSPPPTPSLANSTNLQAWTNQFESALPHIKLVFGASTNSGDPSTDSSGNEWTKGTAQPFNFQLGKSASAQGGFQVWQNAYFDPNLQRWLPLAIPEGNIPMLWPEVILSKLIDVPEIANPNAGQPGQPAMIPDHSVDPASLTAQGSAGAPVVIMQGITLLEQQQSNVLFTGQPDTLFNTALGAGTNAVLGGSYNGTLFTPSTNLPTQFTQDHITVALRPAVICFSGLFDTPPVTTGTLVTPYSAGQVPGASSGTTASIIPTDLFTNANQPQPNTSDITGQQLDGQQSRAQVTNLVSQIQYGCLPPGRYAINVVYPDGQAWTVPNEAGACSGSEGTTQYGQTPLSCTIKPRPVLYSQGNRAVVEITKTTNPANCQGTPPPPTNVPSAGIVTGAPPGVPTVCQVVTPQ